MQLSVTQFRAQCLSLLEDVPEGGILVTKRGRPLARIVPIQRSPKRKKGKMVLSALIVGGTPGPAMPMTETPYDLIFD